METSLRVDDVCRILEAGAKFGVRELNFSGLHVQYGQPVVAEAIPPSQHRDSAPIPADLTETQHKTLAKTALEKEEVETREAQLAELMITDPLRYEQMLQNGDLTDESADDDGDGLDSED